MIGPVSGYTTNRIQTALASASAAGARDMATLAGASSLSDNDTAATAAGALGLASAMRNAQQAGAFARYADDTLAQFAGSLQNLRELAVRAGSETFGATDRIAMKDSAVQMVTQAATIMTSARFNGQTLFQTRSIQEALFTASRTFQVGANANESFSFSGSGFDLSSLSENLSDPNGFWDLDAARSTMDGVDRLLETVGTLRAELGTAQVIMESRTNLMNSQSDALASVWSGIDQDVMTSTAMSLAKNVILNQSATAILAQANVRSKDVMALILHRLED